MPTRQRLASTARRAAVAAAIAVLALLSVWWHSRPDGRLHLLFPAGRGDALIVITPAGHTLLIDGGADPATLPLLLGRRLPVWQRHIDALVLTSADSGRLPGILAVTRRYSVRSALLPSAPRSNAERALVDLLQAQGAAVRIARAGNSIEIDGVRLLVTAAQGERLALRLEYRSFAGMLAPAAQGDALAGLAARPAQLLFYPWAGPGDRALAERIGARLIVYGEGEQTSGYAERSTYLERGSLERKLLHERVDGQIEVISNGRRSWIRTGEG